MLPRSLIVLLFLLLSGCGSGPAPQPADPTTEAWYGATVQGLESLNRDAEEALAAKNPDKAATAVTSGLALEKRLLSVRKPTFAAAEAVTDLDRLYRTDAAGEPALRLGSTDVPEEPGAVEELAAGIDKTARRVQQAKDDIAECDRGLF